MLISGSGGVLAAVFDSDVRMWKLDLDTSFYDAHKSSTTDEWLIYAESDNPYMVPQWASYFWGDYVDDSVSALTLLGSIGADVAVLKKIETGRWKITQNNQFLIYDSDGETVLFRFALKDVTGQPTIDKIYERTHL